MNTSSGKNPNELNLLSLPHTLFSLMLALLLSTIQYYVLIKQGNGMRQMHEALNKVGILNVIQSEALGKSVFKDRN
jgi:hypothetical protein